MNQDNEEAILARLEKIETIVHQTKDVLTGNREYGTTGVLQEMSVMKNDLHDTKNKVDKMLIAGGLFVTILTAFALITQIVGCGDAGWPAPINAERREYAANEAETAAYVWAAEEDGNQTVHPLTGTSMMPYIPPGSWVVIRQIDFKDVTLGKVYGYRPIQANQDFTLHRALGKDMDGYIMCGDNTPVCDRGHRMTKDNIVGELAFVAAVK